MAVSGLGSGMVAVAAGMNHTCAVTSGGAVWCWGWNTYGQLGDGTTTLRLTPVTVSGLTGVVSVGAGLFQTCALTGAGALTCWGRNDYGQVGDGTTTNRLTPVAVTGMSSGVVSAAGGYFHTCALASLGHAQCWGRNYTGQLGDGTTSDRVTPATVSGLGSGTVAVASGYYHGCARTSGGAVQCWGLNGDGQLGDGTTSDRLAPATVVGFAGGVYTAAGGESHTCRLTSAGGVECWGRNADGQLGDGTTTTRVMPGAVSGLASGMVAVVAGAVHSCALTWAGGVWCWGDNSSGQLGDRTTTDRTTPVEAFRLGSGVVSLAAGALHTCAVRRGGGVLCWGYNGYGQLGDGTTTGRDAPVAVAGLTDAVAVTAGMNHTCAVTRGGAVWCWGLNSVRPAR